VNKILGFHGSEDSSEGLLGCNATQCCSRTPMFWRTLLLPWRWRQQDPLKMVSYHNTTQCHNTETLDLNLHHSENLKSCKEDHILLSGLWHGFLKNGWFLRPTIES